MKKDIPWDKLGKYISGEAFREERKAVEMWVESDPEHAELLEELQNIWNSKQKEEWDVDSAWENISESLIDERRTPLRLVKTQGNMQKNTEYFTAFSRNRWGAFRIAASLILIVSVLLTLMLFLEQPTSEDSPAMQELV